ncbi:hypothetical protein J8273_0124 [Carpediemonas membranifera]|uniref:Uncharacterized protein n=1 Tax=Carpediemonas membranifera TaxID=201153 RepID=A0A8J6E2Y7_9EUKA|nr:hypothetical protein J8273_0124 [Carpediemonas membranifera]|eukprot:KAG9394916.1 hypothetical protein J8273_0124 [Carpediemonas membranifera]
MPQKRGGEGKSTVYQNPVPKVAKKRTIQHDINDRIRHQADIHDEFERSINVTASLVDSINVGRNSLSELLQDVSAFQAVFPEVERLSADVGDIFRRLQDLEKGMSELFSLNNRNQLLRGEVDSLRVIRDRIHQAELDRAAGDSEIAGLERQVVLTQERLARFTAGVEDRKRREKGVSGRVTLTDRLEVAATRLPKVPKALPLPGKSKKKGGDVDLLELAPPAPKPKKRGGKSADDEFAALESLLIGQMKK